MILSSNIIFIQFSLSPLCCFVGREGLALLCSRGIFLYIPPDDCKLFRDSYIRGIPVNNTPPRKFLGHLGGVFLSTVLGINPKMFRLRRAIWNKRPHFWRFQDTPFRFVSLLFKLKKKTQNLLNKKGFQSTEAWSIVSDMFMSAAGDFLGVLWMSGCIFTLPKHHFLLCFGCKIPKISGLRPDFSKGGTLWVLKNTPLPRKYLGHLGGGYS